MYSSYRPCSFFDEPIITSNGVIFGLETSGQYIMGQLPSYIQQCHNRNGDVPYLYSNSNYSCSSQSTYQQAPVTQAPVTQAPVTQAPAKPESQKNELSRDERFKLESQVVKKTGLIASNTYDFDDYKIVVAKMRELADEAEKKGIDSITYHISSDPEMLKRFSKPVMQQRNDAIAANIEAIKTSFETNTVQMNGIDAENIQKIIILTKDNKTIEFTSH